MDIPPADCPSSFHLSLVVPSKAFAAPMSSALNIAEIAFLRSSSVRPAIASFSSGNISVKLRIFPLASLTSTPRFFSAAAPSSVGWAMLCITSRSFVPPSAPFRPLSASMPRATDASVPLPAKSLAAPPTWNMAFASSVAFMLVWENSSSCSFFRTAVTPDSTAPPTWVMALNPGITRSATAIWTPSRALLNNVTSPSRLSNCVAAILAAAPCAFSMEPSSSSQRFFDVPSKAFTAATS